MRGLTGSAATGLCAIGVFVGYVMAGDVAPPPGPVASTMKTMVEVEPRIAINAVNTPGDANSLFRISQPGSYYLTGNVLGVEGLRGVEIGADNVTIDLMGFTMQGTLSGGAIGIATDGAHNDITIRNGTVRDWGGAGINLVIGGVGTTSCIESVRALNNVGAGIRSHENSILRDCIARVNGGAGFVVVSNSIVERCLSTGNALHGYDVLASMIRDCFGNSNAQSGFFINGACIVEGNRSAGNDWHGFELVGVGGRIEGNMAIGNELDGFFATDVGGNLIIRNSSRANSGLQFDLGNFNSQGAVVNVTNVGDMTGTPNIDNPWVNFAY